MGEMIRVGEIELFVEEQGAGPAILMLHGFPDDSALWRNQIPVLAGQGFRVIAPDLRGFGRSDKPKQVDNYFMPQLLGDVTGLLDVLQIEKATIVAHDWGAALAWLMASFSPDRVERLVAISVGHPTGLNRPSVEQLRKSWYIFLFQLAGLAEESLRADDWKLFRQWLDGAHDTERYIEAMSKPDALTPALNWYRANASPALFFSDQPPFPKVVCPVMGVWGSNDPFLGEEQMLVSESWVEGDWRYERIEGAGHWIPIEAPEKLNSLLGEFLT